MQKAAFEALQVKKDRMHRQIRNQVSDGEALDLARQQPVRLESSRHTLLAGLLVAPACPARVPPSKCGPCSLFPQHQGWGPGSAAVW